MEKQFKQILTEQVILAFHQKGLDELIVFFIAKYPNFSYIELAPERLTSKYLEVFDISFLASYIRYCELSFLESGMRDANVKRKLCFLHEHIGTIIAAYRNFIQSDDITLEDLNRWLPLLCDLKLKNRLMKGVKVTDSYKRFVDMCLDKTSAAYQNLILLDQIYSTVIIDIGKLGEISNQESLLKLLRIVIDGKIDISYDSLFECFFNLQGLLEKIPFSILPQYYFVIEEYLRESTYFPVIHTWKEFQEFCNSKENKHRKFLETEYRISTLKEFYSWLFLGIHYYKFQTIFPTLQDDGSKQYLILKELYEAKFPLALKQNLYQKFMNFGNLRPYLEDALMKRKRENDLKLKTMLAVISKGRTLITVQNSSFCFVTSSIEEYQNSKNTIFAKVQSDTNFSYQEGCLIAYSNPSFISCEENTCVLQKKELVPEFLIAFDIVSYQHLVYQKQLGLPIIIINTESYAEKFVYALEKLYANGDWDSYLTQKRNFFFSIQTHPWLFTKYFNSETLFEDVKVWQQKIEKWMLENLPSSFLKTQLSVLENLISLNEELEAMFQKEKKTSFQYRKKMLQYGQIKG